MTGYASAQSHIGSESPAVPGVRLGLEIRSVNSRYLDVSFRLPDEFRQLEPGLRDLINKQIEDLPDEEVIWPGGPTAGQIKLWKQEFGEWIVGVEFFNWDLRVSSSSQTVSDCLRVGRWWLPNHHPASRVALGRPTIPPMRQRHLGA
ncbi:MAG: hypothetical protein EBW49_05665, partial [Betaproteobacteria bacterium]|nr:hypothetical protein [Betaproteobacteria bacterium]